ncbi:LysR family transcriptional regulator [Peribacillus acanthi]|uniref:LysR family transcriptional regulator n=1 Tax=Peribacillus acanthi TaxID=2171554 RepID=UPI000D3E77F9|nr:LysR family transcriptional regulator [Peribacillus acanthi]
MNIEQMKYMVEVAKERSITKAAAKLHISPSAVSQAIAQLESEMGLVIFNRSKKGMHPTNEGNMIISKSYEILHKIQELQEEIDQNKKGKDKVLRVACAPAMTYIVYDAFLSFTKTFSDVKVMIEELDQDKILEAMKIGSIDLAISPFSKSELEEATYEYGIGFELIYKGFICVCVNSQSKLASLQSISPEDLKNEKVVIYNSNRGKMFNERHLPNKDIFVSSNNIEVLRTAILHSHAFTLIFNFTFKNNPDVKNGSLTIIPYKNPDITYQDFWMLYSLTKGLSTLAKEFQKRVIQLLEE